MDFPEFSGQLSDLKLGADILNMVSKTLRVSRNLMPIEFDRDSGVLTIVTSNFADNFADYAIILKLISNDFPEVKAISFLSCDYDNYDTNYDNVHGKYRRERYKYSF